MKKLIVFLFVLVCSIVSADDYNFTNTLIGERAFGLAGAFTALSDDSSGCYYNPAGIAFVDRSSLSLSSTVYSFQTLRTENAFQHLEAGVIDAESSVMTPIPSTVATVKKIYDFLTVGICAIVPDYTHITIETMITVNNALYSLRRNLTDQTLFVGPTAAYKILDNLSVGMSVFYATRTYSLSNTLTNTEDITVTSPLITISTSDTYIDHSAFLLLFGVKYDPTPDVHLGLSIRTPSIKKSGKGSVFLTIVDENSNFTAGTNLLFPANNLGAETKYPMKMAAGVAYGRKKEFMVSFDSTLFVGSNYNLTEIGSGGSAVVIGAVEQKNIVNFALGGEYYFKEEFPVRLGAYTNLSANSVERVEEDLNYDKIDYFGGTLGVGYESKNSSLNLGLSYALGSGKSSRSFGETVDNMTVKDFSGSQLGILIGGSYYFD
ncbi:MAG: outer membrane protein transport protein [Pseudomonadota bacterium]